MTAPTLPADTPPIDTETTADPAREAAPATTRGKLLDLEPEAAAKEAERLWKQHDWFHKKHAAYVKQHAMWRAGDRFVKLVVQRDEGTVKLVMPAGLDALPQVPNKVEEKIRDGISTIMADPPKPDAEPASDDPRAREAALFSTRFLTAQAGESGLNTDQVMYAALDLSATYRSAFVEVCYDPNGGGYVPLTIQARPSATTTDDAETGVAGPDGRTDTRPFVTKYVMPDNTLSDSPSGAQMTWQASLTLDLLTSNQVRFLPRLTGGVQTAKGVVIARFRPWQQIVERYPEVATMDDEARQAILSWRVPDYRRLLPDDYDQQALKKPTGSTGGGTPDDDTLVCELTVYYRSHPAYPKGCDAVFLGGKYRVKSEVLAFENANGSPETMDLPLAQMRWEVDADGGNPYGETPVRRLGPLDEMRTALYTGAMEYLHRFMRPRPLLPMGTTIQPEDLADWDKALQYNPVGKPEWFPLPDFPQMGPQFMDRLDADLEGIMGIAGPAMGQVAGSVRSADQQNTLIERATVAITQVRENAKDCYERLHRLILQMARRHFTVPQLVAYVGDDGAYQVQEFSRADFGSTKQVQVRRGTFTGMTPMQKNEIIAGEMQMGALDPQEAARYRRDNIAPMVGLQDNVHLQRIKRHLSVWRKGPSAEQQAQAAQQQAALQQQMAAMPPQVDPATGQPVPPPDPMHQMALGIFPRLPVDDEQPVAILRHAELAKALTEVEFYNFPPGWNQALLDTYLHAKQMAGVMTVVDQQMAAQQQQAMQQEQDGADKDRDDANRDKDRAADVQKAQIGAQAKQQAQPQPAMAA